MMRLKYNQIEKLLLGIAIFILSFVAFYYKVYYHLFGIITVPITWFLRYYIKNIVKNIRDKGFIGFLTLGWMAAMTEEAVYWFGGFRLLPGISLIGDFIVTTPAAILIFSFWWWLNSRYIYSIKEKFILGGILGILTESLKCIDIFPILIWILIVIQAFIIYGWGVMFPFWLMQDQIQKTPQKRGITKYILGVLLPWLGIIIYGILWLPFIKSIYSDIGLMLS